MQRPNGHSQTGRLRIARIIAVTLSGAALSPPPSTPADDPHPAGELRPADAANTARTFQPGVRIDWANRVVGVDAVVVLREGPLEFFACFPGKEHESILRIEAAAVHLYQALGLIGLEPGRPPAWDADTGTYRPAEGDLVDVSVQTDAGEVPAHAWLLDLEYNHPTPPRAWVFAGSLRLPDGGLAAQHSGAGIALVDFGDSLLALTRPASSSDSDLWAQAATADIPEVGTQVELRFQPARPSTARIELDFRGVLRMDARPLSMVDFLDWLEQRRRLRPEAPVRVVAERALAVDRRALRVRLLVAGYSADFVEMPD